MTDDEFNEKYGDIWVHFTSYYKYVFRYVGDGFDGETITVGYGGNHDDIYRHEVTSCDKQKIGTWSDWSEVHVIKDGVTLYHKYNY